MNEGEFYIPRYPAKDFFISYNTWKLPKENKPNRKFDSLVMAGAIEAVSYSLLDSLKESIDREIEKSRWIKKGPPYSGKA